MKNDINSVLKNGINTKIIYIDYAKNSKKNRDLTYAKKLGEAILKSKYPDINKMASYTIDV